MDPHSEDPGIAPGSEPGTGAGAAPGGVPGAAASAELLALAERARELFEGHRSTVTGTGLLEAARVWEEFGMVADAARVWVAAEMDHESCKELGDEGLAVSQNFTSARTLLSATTGVSDSTARDRMSLGRRLRSRVSLTGLTTPSAFPAVEEAVFQGRLGVDAATVITQHLSTAVTRVGWSVAVEDAERTLVAQAVRSEGGFRFGADAIAALASRVRDHLDPDGVEPRDADKQAKRGFSVPRIGPDGIARGSYAFPPEQLGIFTAALEPFLNPRTAVTFTEPGDTDPFDTSGPDGAAGLNDTAGLNGAAGPGRTSASGTPPGAASRSGVPGSVPPGSVSPDDTALFADTRSRSQKVLDALMSLLQMASASPEASKLNGAAPTVNVHVTLEDLAAGRGAGWIDGCTQPIPLSTVNQYRCHGNTITTLLGIDGEILHHGKTRRLATAQQRRALAVRDGGCVWPGCDRPPSWCEAHHVEEWQHADHPPGRTDTCNLVLLCHFHHKHLHTSAWKLIMLRGKPHILPPSEIDWRQTPRPVGRPRAG